PSQLSFLPPHSQPRIETKQGSISALTAGRGGLRHFRQQLTAVTAASSRPHARSFI
ncbi:unnamed protein product, partial [Ectocarpus fasciculatus]